MDVQEPSGCPRCAELERIVKDLAVRVAQLEADLAKAKKNSSNSSKPPSSDIAKPPKPPAGEEGKRKQGARPGHTRKERLAFGPEEIDKTRDHTLDSCPDCGGHVRIGEQPPRILQQIEINPRPITITEHRGLAFYCPHCDKTHYAPIPQPVVQAGLVGPELTSFVAYLKGACHCSFSTIRKLLRDVIGVTISRGQLAKLIAKVSKSLETPYEQLLNLPPDQSSLNVDETGHKDKDKDKDKGERMWTWCFRAHLFTLFKIAPSRGSAVLVGVLGQEFNGVLGCDYFSAYRKYMGDFGVLVQFCLAHLIRDLRFLAKHPNPENQVYGERVLEATRKLFEVFHRRDTTPPAMFTDAMENAGKTLCATAVASVPLTSEAKNLATRFEKHGASYIRFSTTPGIEPTNNLAEQAIRFVVIDRRVTQGSRGEAGQRWLERIWTVMATCSQQGRSVYTFLCDTIRAFFNAESPPTLVPNTS